jgi:D-alanyl-D-alanine carboxypeptidase
MKNKIVQSIDNKIHKRLRPITSATSLLVILILLTTGANYINAKMGLEKSKSHTDEIAANIANEINSLKNELQATKDQNVELSNALQEAFQQDEDLTQNLRRITDTVDDLEKLNEIDAELLQKYSKVYFLNEHYTPTDLKTIPSKYTWDENRDYEIHHKVYPFLIDLLEDAKDDDLDLKVISAFRSFNEQATLKGAYTVTYGAGTANQFSADQGYSEHQLGTTVDFTNSTVGASYSGFAQTEEYKWLQKNADKYGFTLSYPEDNQYYQFEPWHWRFVGEDLADDLDDKNEFFYDWDQRKIDKYLIKLFD